MESPWGERDWQYYTDYSELPLCILQLDPADRAVIRIADERDAVQKKTFTKWVNKHLLKAGRKILDLYEDLRDGHNLISLLEVLAHEILPRERGHMRFHKIQNVQIALDFLRMKGIKLVNIRSDEIVDGNPKLTLGLIWTIILHFQISDVVVPGQEDITAKEALLLWSRRTTDGYPGVKIRDFSSSWRDGRAFLSILHRNRPDLVDIRQMKQNSNKQNLESAFSIAERELGVTRLLDTDDVDVPNPDEKSIITYVSSLYDVFPEEPSVEQSLKDNERKLKAEEYREQAASLLTWIRDSIKLMLSRNYPSTLIEIKALQSGFNRFRNEDVPPHLEVRNKLLKLFDEIQSLTTDPSQMSIEDEFLPHNVSRMWSRFEAAMQERDMTLQAEVIRLERLHRLAEKVQRDIRYNEETLADLSRRIEDTVRGQELMHAFEAKRNCDALDRALKGVEESLRGLFRDCQILQDGSHPQAEQLYKRVSDLQAKVSSLRNHLHSQVLHPLMARPGDDVREHLTKTQAEVVSEGRLMETHPAFRHLQDCLDWIDAKQRHLEETKYESELTLVLEQLAVHKTEHEEIQSFRSHIDKCISDRINLSSEEQKVYTQKLSKVEVAYSLLSKTSSRRLRCLESLGEFIQLATAEMSWLSEREEVELSRDWGAKDLNLPELDEYHKCLVRQMESRESQFNAVQEKGGAMILDRHPSARTVEAYMSSLQSQWSWLVQLRWCLEAQIKHCTDHNRFFEEAQHCEQWMARHSELLQNRFCADNIPIDQAQVLLAELQDLQDQIREYDRRISSLVIKSRDIIPLKLRCQRVTAPIRVRTLCACHQQDVSLQRGEECFLVNNSQKTKWKVKTMTGLEVEVPSVCLLIPPPNQEAIDMANRLKLQHERLTSQWKTQQRKVRMAAIFATIRQIKSWDLKKFLAMDPAQREAVWRALKEDGQKLIAECGTSDRDMRKLSEELRECERIYQDLCEKAAAKESHRGISTAQAVLQKVETLSRELSLTDQQLSALLHRPLAQNNLAVQESFRSYREFQLKFDKQESEMRILQTEVKELSPRSSNIESKLNLVVQKMEQMKTLSHLYVDRLKGCEVVISGLNDMKQLVADFESSLASHDNMTSDLSELKTLKNELVGFQETLQQHQPKLQQLQEDVESLRTLVERSRPGTSKHHDVDSLEKEVDDLVKCWDQICIQVVERMRSVGSCQNLLTLYHNGLHTEQTWASQMQKRISSQPPLTEDVTDAKRQLEPTMAIYNSLGDRRHQLESVNRHGGQFIREAKIADQRLKQFKDSVAETDRSSDVPDSKKLKHQDGSDVVRDELDHLNKLYIEMVDWANIRLKQITSILTAHGEMQFQMVIDEEMPLLRTFRAELAKRSSLLVDSDMREYFTQQFEGPTPSQASYGATPEQLFKTTLQLRPETSINSEFAEVTKVIRLLSKSQEEDSAVDGAASTPIDLAETLKAMENSSTPVSILPKADSKLSGRKEPIKHREQIVITIKKEEITPRGQVLHVAAIFNPLTTRKVTLVEALQIGLLDTKTKSFTDPSTRQKLPLAQAAKKGFIDEVVLKQLTSPCGTQDPQTGEELSLLEAIQKKLYDPVSNTFADITAGEQVSVSEAVARGIISESCSRILIGETVEVTSVTRTLAVFTNAEPFKLDSGLSLGMVLEKNLCSEITGTVTEPISGVDMNIMEAVEKGFIDPSCHEIKDPKGGGYLTLTEAVAAGVVDPFKGTYSDKTTGQKLPLSVALSKGLVRTALSLADVVSQGSLTEDGQVFDHSSGQILTLAEAFASGVISVNKKCILNPQTDEVMSIKDAVTSKLMTPSGLFVSPDGKSQVPVLEALTLGLVKLAREEVHFSSTGVKDPRINEVVTLSEALKRSIITPQGAYVDSRTGREMSLQQAANSGLVDLKLMKDLQKPTSIKTAQGRHVSIAEALKLGIVDAQTGSFENVRTGERHTMQEAVSQGLITASDATKVLSLLSSVTTITTVLTQVESTQPTGALTISQAISQGYLNEKTGIFRDPKTGHLLPLDEAIRKGLLRLSSEGTTPPSPSAFRSDNDSQNNRLLSETFMTDTSGGASRTIPIEPGSKKLESSFMTKTGSQFAFTTTTLAKPLVMHSVISETREITLKSVLDPRTGRELDVEDAVKRGLISIENGQYTNPMTGEKMSLNKAIDQGLIKAERVDGSQKGGVAIKDTRVFSIVGVLHPVTRKRLTVSQALAEGFLNQTQGVYNLVDGLGNQEAMKISEAIEKGYVLVEDIGDLAAGPDSMLRETKSYILKAVVHPITGKHMSIADAIDEGILDDSEGLYINPLTGESMHIHSAIEKGFILAELTSVKTDVDRNVNKITTTKLTTLAVTAVVDPRTGNLISVSKAIEEGILNQTKGIYVNPLTGESMTLSDAIDKRLVLAESPEAQSDDPLDKAEISSIHITDEQESHETTLIEDVRSETVTMSITSVVDPATMQMISYDRAVDSGILNVRKGLYVNPFTGESMTISTALEKGLIHGEITSKRRDDDLLRSSVSSALPAVPLKDITSVIDPRNQEEISFDKAVKDGIINPEKGTYINPRTNMEISLMKAKELGYLLESKQSSAAQLEKSIEEGDLLEARLSTPRLPRETNKPWSIVDMELEKTVIIDGSLGDSSVAREVLHYSAEVEQGSDAFEGRGKKPHSLLVVDPVTGEQLTMDVALEKGLVDRSGSVVDRQAGKKLSPQEALKMGLMVIAGAPLVAGKMVVDAIKDRSSNAKTGVAHSEVITEGTESRLSPTRNIARRGVTVTRSDSLQSEDQKVNDTQVDGRRSPGSPIVGVVGKPVTITVDPGSLPSSSVHKTSSAATFTFQQRMSTSSSSEEPTSDTADVPSHKIVSLSSKYTVSEQSDRQDGSSRIPAHLQDIKLRSLKVSSVKNVDINWESGEVTDKLSSKKLTVKEAVEKGIIDSDLVKLIAQSSSQKSYGSPDVNIDWVRGSVIDQSTNETLNVEEALKKGLINMPTASALATMHERIAQFTEAEKPAASHSTEPYTSRGQGQMSVSQAIDSGLFDDQRGVFHDQTTNKDISFQEAVDRGHIDGNLTVVDVKTGEVYSLEEGLKDGRIDAVTGHYVDEESGKKMTLKEAAKLGVLALVGAPVAAAVAAKESLSSLLSDRRSKDSSPEDRGSFPAPVGRQLSSDSRQIRRSVSDSTSPESMTLTEAISSGHLSTKTGIFTDPITGRNMQIRDAVMGGLIDKDSASILDSETGKAVNLEYALQHGLLDDRGRVVDSQTGLGKDLKQCISDGTLQGVQLQDVSKTSCQLVNTRTGESLTMNDTVKQGLLKGVQTPDSVRATKGYSREEIDAQIEELAALGRQDFTSNGVLVSDLQDKSRLTSESENGLYSNRPLEGTNTDISPLGSKNTFTVGLQKQKTQEAKQISVSRVYDPRTGLKVGLDEAIERGLVDETCSVFNDPVTGAQMKIEDAMKEGLVAGFIQTVSTSQSSVTSKKPAGTYNITGVLDTESGQELSVEEAMNRKILDPSGTYTDPLTGEVIPLAEAMKLGYVLSEKIKNTHLSSNMTSLQAEPVTFQDAMEQGLINPNVGTFFDASSQKTYSVDEAVRSGLIVASDGKLFEYRGISDTGVTYSFKAALQTGIISSETCLFYDSLTGECISIQAALQEGYLSPVAGTYGGRAVGESIVMLKEGVASSAASTLEEIIDSKTGEKLSLDEAERRGLVSVVKNDSKMTLSEAITSGLVDSNTGLLHDPVTGESMSIDQAVMSDIITVSDAEDDVLGNGYSYDTDTEPMNIATAISQGYLDTTTATFTDPFTQEALSVSQAIQKGLLKPTLTVEEPAVYHPEAMDGRRDSTNILSTSNKVVSDVLHEPSLYSASGLTTHIKTARVSSLKGLSLEDTQPQYMDEECIDGMASDETSSGGRHTSSRRSSSQDRCPTPATPGRMADSYDKLVKDIATQLQRLQDFEQELKEATQMGDETSQIQQQLEAHKALHEDILGQQQPILSLVYQAEQLTELYQEEITPEQVTALSGEAAALKKALEKVVKTSDRRLKHLTAAAEELSKVETEINKFNTWKASARSELLRQEACLQRFEDLNSVQDSQKELMNDITSHQADIRYISISVQKFVEEAKLYKLEVDSYRADRQRPARSSLISMDCTAADVVKEKLKDVTDDYTDLKHKCSAFGDRLSELNTKQRNFNDAAFKMLTWLTDTEDKLASITQDSDTPDSGQLEGQLARIKSLSSEVLSQTGLMDEIHKKGHELTNSFSGVATDRNQVELLEKNMQEIDARYSSINEAVSSQAKLLQATITQSQDIQGAIADIQARLRSAQVALTTQQPISLELPLLAQQEQQFRLLAADVHSYADSVESIRQATRDLIKSGDLHVARALEQHLADIDDKFKEVDEACDERGKALKEVGGKLGEFHDRLNTAQNWLQSRINDVTSSDFNSLPVDEAKEQLSFFASNKKQNENEIAQLKELAKELREDERTGSPASINKAVAELDKTVELFDVVVGDKLAEIAQREKQANEFETAKTMMLLWLAQMEARADEFEPAAVEVDVVEQQIADLQPMLVEYEEQGPKVDEVNDLGNALEILTNSGDRPLSPIRRFGRSRRIIGLTSPHLRSPSPTFPLSPTALKTSMSSESSGISSRKSSSDNILLDDLSETQQQLLDINQRYEILGERLADRQQELQNVLASIRTFLQDMQDILSWLDVKDGELSAKSADGIPANEKTAKKKLKEHEEFHRELLNKEGLVEDIRKKAQELLKSKPGATGLDSLQSQLTDLDEKWHGLRAASEEHRKSLEDAVTDLCDFREYEDQLSKWFSQKEKLMDVLGPVAMEPSLLNSQMEQVKVLKEEFASQEPTLEQFVNTGHSILDWCHQNASDTSAVSKRMDAISKSWKKLQGRLKEREKNIESLQGLSGEFSSVSRELANWLGEFSDRIDGLPKVSSQPDKQQAQKQEMQRLHQEMQNKLPEITKAKDLCQQLSDTTKDLSTKTDLKAKMAALDKDINDTLKKLESRAAAIEEASRAGEEFTTNCQQMLGWIQTTSSVLMDTPPLSSDSDLLQKQAVETKAMRQDLNLKEVEIRSLLDKGNRFLHEASPTAETKAFKETLAQIESEWGDLKDTVKEREEKIKAASSHAQEFQQSLDKMSWWLGSAEERLKKIKPEFLDKASIAAKLKELQSLQNEFLKKSHDHDNFNKTATSLLATVEDPDHELQQQVEEVNRRWDHLNSGLSERADYLEDLQSRLAEIDDNKLDVKHSLTRWEDKLAAHLDMGTAARDPKHIDKIKAIQDDISALEPQLDYLDKLMEGLDLTDVNSRDLEGELRGLRDRYEQLQGEVEELISNMETGSSIVGQFRGMMKKVASDLSDLDNDLSNMKPVSRDENELEAQLQEIQNFQAKLANKSEPLVDLKEQAQDLQLAGFVTDPDGLNAQVETLLSQHSRLKDSANDRLSEIESTIDKVHAVSDALKSLRQKTSDAVSTIDSMKPVGSSANQIKDQQEELKTFNKNKVEPLQKEISQINSDIEALIKTALSGVNSGGIDEDLEGLQESWAELNEKVSERERNLDKALLQSGKFKEALASILVWMEETEETVANQKPPSPEFRVVKAQLQEQKLLQKMLDDRASSVRNVKETGEQLLSGLEGAELSRMDTELKSLDERWTALTGNASERMKTLEEISKLGKSFQDIHEPLALWLEVTDKRFTSLEPKSSSAGGFEKLINNLKQLQTEITEREGSVKELTALGKRLQDFCKGEDVIIVQLKIDEVQKQFGDLKNKVDDSLEQMEEALPLAENFHEAHEKFMDWVAKVEPELRGKELLGADAEEKVEDLLQQLDIVQPYLDIINSEGAELAEIAPGDAGVQVEETIKKDNKRFEGLRQQIEKRAEKVNMSRQKSLECINELDDLMEWFDKGEDKLSAMSGISAEPGRLQKQLAEMKSFSEEVNNQKVRARDAVTSGKKLLRDSSKEDVSAVQEKMDQLKSKADSVGSLASERLSGLEQALPLARSFQETHENLVSWLDEVEPALADLEVTTVDAQQVRKQQESIKALKQDVADHKPVIDRLNKTGSALVQVVSPESAVDIQNKLDDDNKRIEEVRSGVRERSNSIDAAMQQSAEFTDKLEDMLETLTTTAESMQNVEPISAFPDKIREQLEENKIVDEDMQMKSDALESVKEAANELIRQAGDASDPAVRDVRQKLEELTRLYSDIQDNCHDRSRALEDALGVSEKFWEDLNTLSGSIKELQEGMSSQEKPALEPEAIREQQEELEVIRDDLAATQADLEELQDTGDQLMSLVGDPERPEIKKNLDDTEQTLNNLNIQMEKRSKDLDVALSRAVTFQQELQKMLVWLQTQEETFDRMEPVASDLDTITQQWNDIKVFKGIVDPKHVEVEALNQQAQELTRDCTTEQAAVVREPVREVNQRWDALQVNITDRQRDIQTALLNLGEFDQAYRDFQSWLDTVDQSLEELTPVYGDPKLVELELAKLRVITHDIESHQENLDLLAEAANKMMAREKAPEANKLKKKMEVLVTGLDKVKDKAAKRQSQLDDARREARGFTEELQDILMKINDLDAQMITSQPVGGLPETAKEQLQKFMNTFEEVEKLEPSVESLQLMSEKLADKSHGDPAASIRQNMSNLQQRWGTAMNRAADRKKKLEDAVGLAGHFHEELNKFIGWLTDTEKTLNNLQPVSRLVDKVTKQIEDHRVLQKDVSGHREAMFALDKMGTHLKYFSQKQDVVLIKNLLTSAQHRWEKIVSRSAERTRHLERGYKEAKQFYDSWKDMIQWLSEAEQALNSDTSISNEPDKIRAQIAKHKEFQRRLGAKQPVYDSINRAGSTLQTRCPGDDKPAIQALLTDLKSRWNSVCGKSVDRQRKLEEGLLFTGQFSEALEALLDWLAKVEPTLAEDTQVHGDLDTVTGFLETHKAFQQELGGRANTVQFVHKSGKDLIEKSGEDMSHVQAQLLELAAMWDRTCKLSVSKQDRLEQAQRLAEEFHNKAQGLLDWLADAERQLRFKGAIPDEETLIVQHIDDHKKFEESMLRQEANLRETLNIGQDIMKRCHPDAVSTMKHWLGVLRTRWEELMALSRQRQRRLSEALTNARLNNSLLEELLAWLTAAEIKLTDLDKEVIPKDLQVIQDLIAQHQDFQNEMSSKQPSVDRLTKADKRKSGSDTGSHIPVFRGARSSARSKIPTIRIDRVDSSGRKTPDYFGRKTPEHFHGQRTPNISGRRTPDVSGRRTPDVSGRRTPDVSGRRTPDVSGRMTPDHSGRKTPDHTSGRRTPDILSGRRTPEPGFHNPRVGALFNKWRHVWLLSMYRQRKLQDALDYLNEVERMKHFDFEDWRKRYLRWMNHNKARIMDFFRRQDHDRDGRVTRQEFIDGILQSKFPTSRLEMEAVADIFDRDGDGFINYKEFVAALRPDRDPKPETDSEKILDEVRRQVSKCTCMKQFKIHKIGEGKYRFGDSQKLRLVRILRSTVMVRVGGGWIALDEFLVKNDPCRVGLWRRKQFRLKRRYLHQNTEEPKGRTNMELREHFVLAEGVSQSMTGFVAKSPAGSSHSSGSSYSGKSASTTSGPITKIREKTVHQTPWRQTKVSPDGEVHQIMSHTDPDGGRVVKHKVTQELRSPRNISSPASRSSSRASTASGSRPTSRTGSEAPDDSPDVYTTVQSDSRTVGGRTDTTVTYQTHNVQTRNVTLPTVTTTKISRIPKIAPSKKK